MNYFEDYADSKDGWARYISHLRLKHSDDPQEIEELDSKMCRGWGLGSSEFKQAVADDLVRDRSLVRLEREDLAELNRSRWDSALGKCLELLGKPRSVSAICGKYAREREGACEWARRLNKLTIDH